MALASAPRIASAPARRQGFARDARQLTPPLTATGASAQRVVRPLLTQLLRSLTTGSHTKFLTTPVGDGALGFWAAAREVWPETREQGCWCHKLVNVLDKLPQRLQPRAKRALHEMMYAERRADCEAARARFEAEYQPKYSKAVESLIANWERLITFFDFPAEHWKHLRTTNVIESPFATVRLRERATRGAGSRTKGLLMAFKLLEMAQLRWRHLDGAQLLPLVRAGVKFADGVEVDSAKHVTQSTDNQPREAA
jgi:putative transposase